MKHEDYDLEDLETAVEWARGRYTQAVDARRPSAALYNEYARLLHTLRLHKRTEP